MPKTDTSRALEKQIQNSEKKKRSAASTILDGTGYDEDAFDDNPKVPIRLIPLEQIYPRDINEFELTNIPQLAESIRECGLIDPISVIHKNGDGDIYTIVSGHRRFTAFKILHKEYPNENEFSKIPAAVYELTDNPSDLKQGLPYIDKETEEELYRESNLQARQLSYEEVAKQIHHIVEKLDDNEYFEKIHQLNPTKSERYSRTKGDRVGMIIQILSSYNYQGWKRETIRCYVKMYDAVKDGSYGPEILEEIENGNYTVKKMYQDTIGKTSQITASAVDKSFKKIDRALETMRMNKSKLTADQKEMIKNMIAEFERLIG